MNRDPISGLKSVLDEVTIDRSDPRWRAVVGAVASFVSVVALVLAGYLIASILVPGLVDAFGSKYVVGGVIALYWMANLSQVVERYVDEKTAELREG